ncbi:uncharacterized protein [Montipora capricornis]|uniref:uncharacterized protein isoform X1 n=1 Tax=Montipora capricornis TaxID=246305 RepID=UPI0035F11234
MANDVGKCWKTSQERSHFGEKFGEYNFKSGNGFTKLNSKEGRRMKELNTKLESSGVVFKENHTDGKLIKKEESVESAPKSRNKIEWESLSQEKLREMFGPRPERTSFQFDDDSLSEDSDDSDDEETEEPVEKRPRVAANCSKN